MLDYIPSQLSRLVATDPEYRRLQRVAERCYPGSAFHKESIEDANQRFEELMDICLATRTAVLNAISPGYGVGLNDLSPSQQILFFQTYNTKGLIYVDVFRVRFSPTFWITLTIDAPNAIVDTECPMKWMLQIYPDHNTFFPDLAHEDLRMLSLIYGVDPEHLSSTLRESDGLFD
jgi:hypothetical protein